MLKPLTTEQEQADAYAYHLERCKGKMAFDSRRAAKTEAKRFRHRVHLYPYHCPICNSWHNSKRDRAEGRAIAETLTADA